MSITFVESPNEQKVAVKYPPCHWEHPEKRGMAWCGAESLGIYAPPHEPITCQVCLTLCKDWWAT